MRPISTAGNSRSVSDAAGFVLIEMLAVVAIVALAVGVAFTVMPHHTGQLKLSALAAETLTMLTSTRTKAIQNGRDMLAVVDLRHRTIKADNRVLTLPSDVSLSVLSSGSCVATSEEIGIVFRPEGSSCGAVVRMFTATYGLRIRVNWYTGHVDVAPGAAS